MSADLKMAQLAWPAVGTARPSTVISSRPPQDSFPLCFAAARPAVEGLPGEGAPCGKVGRAEKGGGATQATRVFARAGPCRCMPPRCRYAARGMHGCKASHAYQTRLTQWRFSQRNLKIGVLGIGLSHVHACDAIVMSKG